MALLFTTFFFVCLIRLNHFRDPIRIGPQHRRLSPVRNPAPLPLPALGAGPSVSRFTPFLNPQYPLHTSQALLDDHSGE